MQDTNTAASAAPQELKRSASPLQEALPPANQDLNKYMSLYFFILFFPLFFTISVALHLRKRIELGEWLLCKF